MGFLEVETPFLAVGASLITLFCLFYSHFVPPTPIWPLVLGLSSHSFLIKNMLKKLGKNFKNFDRF